jgi:hypothetical protein
MSILIKGMKMPVIDLEWTIRHGADGKWYAIDTNAETSDGEWHEIIPVPPHGNLIDVNALPLEENVPTVIMHDGERWISAYELAMAPTIIPAEQEA